MSVPNSPAVCSCTGPQTLLVTPTSRRMLQRLANSLVLRSSIGFLSLHIKPKASCLGFSFGSRCKTLSNSFQSFVFLGFQHLAADRNTKRHKDWGAAGRRPFGEKACFRLSWPSCYLMLFFISRWTWVVLSLEPTRKWKWPLGRACPLQAEVVSLPC